MKLVPKFATLALGLGALTFAAPVFASGSSSPRSDSSNRDRDTDNRNNQDYGRGVSQDARTLVDASRRAEGEAGPRVQREVRDITNSAEKFEDMVNKGGDFCDTRAQLKDTIRKYKVAREASDRANDPVRELDTVSLMLEYLRADFDLTDDWDNSCDRNRHGDWHRDRGHDDGHR